MHDVVWCCKSSFVLVCGNFQEIYTWRQKEQAAAAFFSRTGLHTHSCVPGGVSSPFRNRQWNLYRKSPTPAQFLVLVWIEEDWNQFRNTSYFHQTLCQMQRSSQRSALKVPMSYHISHKKNITANIGSSRVSFLDSLEMIAKHYS